MIGPSPYVSRVCSCGRVFSTDCNEGHCSAACEDRDAERAEREELRAAERAAEDLALDACRPFDG